MSEEASVTSVGSGIGSSNDSGGASGSTSFIPRPQSGGPDESSSDKSLDRSDGSGGESEPSTSKGQSGSSSGQSGDRKDVGADNKGPNVGDSEVKPEGEGADKVKLEEEKAKEKKAKTWKFKVNGEEREYGEEQISKALNEEDYFQRGQKALTEAGRAKKEAEELKSAAQRTLVAIRDGGPEQIVKLMTMVYDGDEDRAIESVLDKFEKWALPIYEEQSLPREQREARAELRKAERARKEREAWEREKLERASREESEKISIAKKQAEIEFQNKIVVELGKANVPNDGYTAYLYNQIKTAAESAGTELGPAQYAQLIQKHRVSSNPPAQAQKPPTGETPPEANGHTDLEKERLANLEKARKVLAEKRNDSGKPEGNQSNRQSKARIVSTQEIREKLEALR